MDTTRETGRSGLSILHDAVRRKAYEMYQAKHWTNAEILLRGILCAEPEDAWSLALYASVLRNQQRYREALELIERAFALAPADDNILAMRSELHDYLRQLSNDRRAH